jgi:hypothetical protein
VGGDPVTEAGVLSAAAGQDGEEASVPAGDVIHGLAAGQLAVRHVEEVSSPDQGHQALPCGDVDGVVRGVAVGHPLGDGHGAIGRDGEDPHQLAEVGAMVLRVPKVMARIDWPPLVVPVVCR